tara:strand:- start:316 stop:441 length:126 start_codon:yes stop_codon:yes gene_type:complete
MNTLLPAAIKPQKKKTVVNVYKAPLLVLVDICVDLDSLIGI